jgi:hypothetical protein
MAAVQEQADRDGGRLARESRYGRGDFLSARSYSVYLILRRRWRSICRTTSSTSKGSLFKRCATRFRPLSATRARWRCLVLHRIAENWTNAGSSRTRHGRRASDMRDMVVMRPFQLSLTKVAYRPYRDPIVYLSNRKILASGLGRPRWRSVMILAAMTLNVMPLPP